MMSVMNSSSSSWVRSAKLALDALVPAPGEVLPEPAMGLGRVVDPGIESLGAHPHAPIVREVDRQPAGDLSRVRAHRSRLIT